MREIRVREEGKNFCWTETNVNPGSTSQYSGSVTHWQCGCVVASGGYKKLCSKHNELPPVIRLCREPVKVNSYDNCATITKYGEQTFLVCSSDHIHKKIRRRVEEALRKGGTGQILRCAEILGVKLD